MRLTSLFLIVLITFACASGKSRLKKRIAKKTHSIHTKRPKPLARAVAKNILTLPSSFFETQSKKLYPPSVLNLKDKSEMVLINAGQYHVTSSGLAVKAIALGTFYIDRHEITITQFKMFRPEYSVSLDKECPGCPATGIDWYNAKRYCQWAGKRLPSQAEWEVSARGSTKNTWPWGNLFFENYANTLGNADGFDGPSPVGSFPAGTSVFGAADMIGNVWEWVNDITPPSPNVLERQPYRIVKGGGWRSQESETTIDFQNIVPANLKNPTFGFRCVKLPD